MKKSIAIFALFSMMLLTSFSEPIEIGIGGSRGQETRFDIGIGGSRGQETR
jgi:hypothetical protein